jgi:hypothetical protein
MKTRFLTMVVALLAITLPTSIAADADSFIGPKNFEEYVGITATDITPPPVDQAVQEALDRILTPAEISQDIMGVLRTSRGIGVVDPRFTFAANIPTAEAPGVGTVPEYIAYKDSVYTFAHYCNYHRTPIQTAGCDVQYESIDTALVPKLLELGKALPLTSGAKLPMMSDELHQAIESIGPPPPPAEDTTVVASTD